MSGISEPDAGLRVALMAALQSKPEGANLAAEMARRGSIELEFYAPKLMDLQQPHERDELYMVARGSGVLQVEGDDMPFGVGDVLFVPAGAEHRFTEFTADFGAWVIFYGPAGGEKTRS